MDPDILQTGPGRDPCEPHEDALGLVSVVGTRTGKSARVSRSLLQVTVEIVHRQTSRDGVKSVLYWAGVILAVSWEVLMVLSCFF